ncbi:MAG: MBL fold metallo-hydrolase [Acidimicrobiales bacterium]|nr:MBL fold metallo-hydrolase [Hyphomonadaceae bacterium]RZV43292.1 MAG: MBL fold metallo-hydrolase [Acidimicrobiales bacterium]
MTRPNVKTFFDEATFTATHIVVDPASKKAAIVDPVLDYDASAGRTSTQSADDVLAYVEKQGLKVKFIIETHVHADHLSGAPYLKSKLYADIVIGAHITDVQRTFGPIFNVESQFSTDGSQFDHLMADGDTLELGGLTVKAIHTPGHTPACTTYVIGDAVFVGDTLFMPDYGTARCDFPGGDAGQLYDSIQKLFALPDETRVFLCHDYKAPGRDEFAWETTIGEEKTNNIHIGGGVSREDYIKMREARDKTLNMPKLILPSVQVNMRAGRLPPAENNGTTYLKIPINTV